MVFQLAMIIGAIVIHFMVIRIKFFMIFLAEITLLLVNLDFFFFKFLINILCCTDFQESSENDRINNFGGIAGRGRKKQDPAVERDLRLSLEECYHGCIKKMKFERRVGIFVLIQK